MAGSTLGLVEELFRQLRWRRFPLGMTDLAALRDALSAGFGWGSREAFRELIVALWAKSAREAEIVRALFARLPWPEGWTAEQMNRPIAAPPGAIPQPLPPTVPPASALHAEASAAQVSETPAPAPVTQKLGSLPLLSLDNVDASDARLLFVEQYPLGMREVAQALRRLRRPLRAGPPVELDVAATIQRGVSTGVSVPPVLVPARRNTSRLLMLVDSGESMIPYKPFVNTFRESVLEAGWLQHVQTLYFNELPFQGTDHSLLLEGDGANVRRTLDPVLGQIEPAKRAELFADELLSEPVVFSGVFQSVPLETVALIISDAGAARRRVDAASLLDTLAFLKALRARVRSFVWLNPLPRALWAHSNAEQLARFAPMQPLDRPGLERAVNILRGQPAHLERPL